MGMRYLIRKMSDDGIMPPIYELVLPSPGEDGFYRQVHSLNCFFFWPKKRGALGYCSRNRTKDFVFLCSHWDEVEHDKILWAYYKDCPRVTVNSMWEFYKAIGYDYKKQKWVKA
jgi:hypothetical protein